MNTTPTRLIYIVICTAAFLAAVFIISLAALCFTSLQPNDKVFAAYVTAGSSVLSFLFGVLVNTRSTPPATDTTTTTTATTAAVSPAPVPATVTIANTPANPVPTTESHAP